VGRNRRLLYLPSFLLLITAFAHPQERPKIGLVLSGGGAKGVAHIPVLRLLDELDFPIDCIAGTSAGGIMGGLYAAGYSGDDIERVFAAVDWEDLFSDRPPRGLVPYFEKRLDGRYQLEFPLRKGIPSTPRGLIAGQKFYNLFSSLFFPLPGDIDFDDLPVPFRCVAVDIITGRQVVLERGSLARALRATMAIPSIFAPVEWDEYLLVDGGLLNNLPVDVVKDMGAQIVITVDLANPLNPRDELATADKILGQSLLVVEVEQKKGKMDKVDLLIWPDMKGLSGTDYFFPDKMARIRERGEEAARKARPALQALKEKYGLTRSVKKDAGKPLGGGQKRVLRQVVFTGNKNIPSSFIARLFELKTDDVVDAARIARQLNELYSLRYFEDIQYEVFPSDERRIDLRLSLRELPRGNLRVGLRYDNHHKLVAAAGLYATNLPFPGLRLENEIEAAGLTRVLTKVSYPTETLNFPVYPLVYARYKDIPTRLYWGDGRVITTYKDRSFSLGGGLGFLLKKSLNLELAYELEKINIKSQAELAPLEFSPTLNPTLRKIELAATIDTLDDRRDPRKGVLFRGLYEGSYKSLGSETAYELAEACLDLYATLRKRNTIRFYGYWGTSCGDVPFYKHHNQGRPADFVGMAYDQLQGNTIKIVRADYSYRYTNLVQFKLMANVAFGVKQRRPDVIYSPGTLWGMGTGIVINTPLGLLELVCGLGSKGLDDPSILQSVAYLELGTRF
jgi:NTE family protein